MSAELKQALYEILTDTGSNLYGVIGSKLYAGYAPQDAAFPYVTYSRVSESGNWFLAVDRNVSKLSQAQFTFECYGLTQLEADDMMDALRRDLDGLKFEQSGVRIRRIFLDTFIDSEIERQDGSEVPIYTGTMNFVVFYFLQDF